MRVLIADDHLRFRSALREDLERGGIEVCAEAGTAAEAISAALRERPDVCLLDMRMPGDGLAAAKAIRRELPATKVILITAVPDEDGVVAAAHAGACGYLAKHVNPLRLPHIVRAVADGEIAYPRLLMGELLRSLARELAVALRGLSGQIAALGCGPLPRGCKLDRGRQGLGGICDLYFAMKT